MRRTMIPVLALVTLLAVGIAVALLRAGASGTSPAKNQVDQLVPLPVGSPEPDDRCGVRGLTGCGGSAVRTRPPVQQGPSPPAG